jgi:hypothetical protein
MKAVVGSTVSSSGRHTVSRLASAATDLLALPILGPTAVVHLLEAEHALYHPVRVFDSGGYL